MDLFLATHYEFFVRLCVAMICGMIIGTERLIAHKTAGMRTYALVSMGSALFVVISILAGQEFSKTGGFDPLRVASQIVLGVGFLGAGMFSMKDKHVTGLTTATGLWVCAGIGMAAGFGLFGIAFLTTLMTLFVFIVLWFVEQRLKHIIPIIEDELGGHKKEDD